MLSFINRPLLGLLAFLLPLTSSIAEDTTYLLTKEKLKCLYAQADSLLSEPADPIVVLLTTQCAKSDSSTLPSGEKTELPVPNPTIGSEATTTLKPEDVLVLKKTQLTCFKRQFNKLMQHPEDSIKVAFSETCTSGEQP